MKANNWHFFRHFLSDAHPEYTAEEIERYVEAWSQPGAATGMINYYRSSVRTPPQARRSGAPPDQGADLGHLGQRDGYLGEDLAEPDHDDVPNLDRVERLPDGSVSNTGACRWAGIGRWAGMVAQLVRGAARLIS